MTALGASSAGKAMRENPAFEIAEELTFDMGWAGSALAAVAGEFEPGGEQLCWASSVFRRICDALGSKGYPI